MAENESEVGGGALLGCGVEGGNHGPVVGCCHVCGLLLCENHVYHLTRTRHFGRVAGRAAFPLVCGNHLTYSAEAGLPPPVEGRVSASRGALARLRLRRRPRSNKRRRA